MSKARLVIAALFVEGQEPAAVAARYGLHRSWVYRLSPAGKRHSDGHDESSPVPPGVSRHDRAWHFGFPPQ